MSELQIHSYLVLATFVLAVLAFVPLLWIAAPYGRHARSGWGPTIPARAGWVIMESPAIVLFVVVFLRGDQARTIVAVMFLALWQFHYVYRSLIFPFRMRETGKRMPLAIAGMAIVFNCLNAYINARWISHFGEYSSAWLAGTPFLLGIACFFSGWAINQHADAILLRLRRPGQTGYGIPRGGMYRWVSCPNYLGEILEWTGWAIATWSPAGAAFAVFTAANLTPRALANHRWYRTEFPDYPPARRALIPGLL